MPSILFASMHNLLDASSGAAISSRETLLALRRSGWRVRALCGDFFDASEPSEASVRRALARLRNVRETTCSTRGVDGVETKFRLARGNDDGIDFLFFIPEPSSSTPKGSLPKSVGEAFLALLKRELEASPPEVYATYGGYWASRIAVRTARRSGAKTVFHLHNLGYDRRELFELFDAVVVPSEFTRRHYRERLGIETTVVPPIIDVARVVAPQRSPRFATFVNPSPEKGLYFFAGLARELDARRPDVSLLVVESRAKVDVFRAIPETRRLKNLHYSESTNDPRAVYAQTRVLLAPSLCAETFGRVVVEASFNGIPTLCSDRGAAPEILKSASELVLTIPERFSPQSRIVPSRAEVAPWFAALVRLWDDDALAQRLGARLSADANERFGTEKVVAQTTRFYASLSDCSAR